MSRQYLSIKGTIIHMLKNDCILKHFYLIDLILWNLPKNSNERKYISEIMFLLR